MGLFAYRLTFAVPVRTAYQYRMPQIANFMHVNPPSLWHEHFQLDHNIRLSRIRLSALRMKGNFITTASVTPNLKVLLTPYWLTLTKVKVKLKFRTTKIEKSGLTSIIPASDY